MHTPPCTPLACKGVDVLLGAWARAFCEPGKNMELVVDARKKPRVQLLLHTSYHLARHLT